MAITHAQVTLPYTSGLPADVASNNFYFETVAAPTPTQVGAIEVGLIGLYNQSLSGNTLAQYLSINLSRVANQCTIKMYDVADPVPRVPFQETSFTLAAATGANVLPQEVALCGSFRAAYASGEPPARRRGRVYFGPLQSGAAASPGDRPAAALMTRVLDGFDFLDLTCDAENVGWCVYSRADGVARACTHIWVDNAFDTQRRRGIVATTRTEQALP